MKNKTPKIRKKIGKNDGYIVIDKDTLYDLYYNQKMSIQAISHVFYVSHVTILNRFKEYGFDKKMPRKEIIRATKKRNKNS